MLTNTYEYLAIILRSLRLVANCIRKPIRHNFFIFATIWLICREYIFLHSQGYSPQCETSITTTIRKLLLSAFGHICRLQPGTQAIDSLVSKPPSSWRRPRGRPPLRWADQIVNDPQMSMSDAVTATYDRTSWRSLVRDATRPTTQAT